MLEINHHLAQMQTCVHQLLDYCSGGARTDLVPAAVRWMSQQYFL